MAEFIREGKLSEATGLTDEEIEEFVGVNKALFYGQYYCGDNTRHVWLPFDYGEAFDSCADYHEFHYVRLAPEIDPSQEIFGYCLFHVESGILEIGHTRSVYDAYNGDYDLDYSPALELTLEDLGEAQLPHWIAQFKHYKGDAQ